MRVRLLLAALVAAAAVPVASAPAHAFNCNDELFPEVCATYYFACSTARTCGLFG
ncbi:MAG TPA: hypothetical protein VNQ77_11745 [Frankiaceae bacterium]|nr:hypothetical protein [Frankiaceae bacterium]